MICIPSCSESLSSNSCTSEPEEIIDSSSSTSIANSAVRIDFSCSGSYVTGSSEIFRSCSSISISSSSGCSVVSSIEIADGGLLS